MINSRMEPSSTTQGADRPRLEAASIGSIAFEAISHVQEARVAGVTSRGIFIRSFNRWLLFISLETYRGPLTINVPGDASLLSKIAIGMPVQVSSRRLVFPGVGLDILTHDATVWRPPSPPASPLPEAERRKRLDLAASLVIDRQAIAGLAPLLPTILRSPETVPPSPPDLSSLQADILQRYEQLRSSPHPNYTQFILSLLGEGDGLTPSGDDFVAAFLLAHQRWGWALCPNHDPGTLDQTVVEAAYQRTTRLSANLIECAANGQADERLIAALDWLVCRTSLDTSVIDALLDWGNSSGCDVLTGFIASLNLTY